MRSWNRDAKENHDATHSAVLAVKDFLRLLTDLLVVRNGYVVADVYFYPFAPPSASPHLVIEPPAR